MYKRPVSRAVALVENLSAIAQSDHEGIQQSVSRETSFSANEISRLNFQQVRLKEGVGVASFPLRGSDTMRRHEFASNAAGRGHRSH